MEGGDIVYAAAESEQGRGRPNRAGAGRRAGAGAASLTGTFYSAAVAGISYIYKTFNE